jgi:ABC-type transporter lipoprotein component MlaA
MTSRDGYRIGCRSAGTAALSRGKVDARKEKRMQYEETKANWTMVKVAGLSKAVRIALEEVLVRADDQYHITQSAYGQRSALSVFYPTKPGG